MPVEEKFHLFIYKNYEVNDFQNWFNGMLSIDSRLQVGKIFPEPPFPEMVKIGYCVSRERYELGTVLESEW